MACDDADEEQGGRRRGSAQASAFSADAERRHDGSKFVCICVRPSCTVHRKREIRAGARNPPASAGMLDVFDADAAAVSYDQPIAFWHIDSSRLLPLPRRYLQRRQVLMDTGDPCTGLLDFIVQLPRQ